jgi:hypothetical protein
MLIYGTDVASWASPTHEHSEAERKKLYARLKLMDAAQAATPEIETSPINTEQFGIADVVVKVRAPPVRSNWVGYEDEDDHDSDEVRWLEQLYGTVEFQEQAIGRLDTKLICRSRFVGSFAKEIEEP